MTLKDLHDQVLHLGFETTALEINEVYVDAVNRALLQVNALRPRIEYKDILHYPRKNLLGDGQGELKECMGEVTFNCRGAKEFDIWIAGAYTITAYKNGETISQIPSGGGAASVLGFKQIIKECGIDTVKISTASRFIYQNAAAFATSGSEAQGRNDSVRYTAYAMSSFLRFASPPIVKEAGYQYIDEGYRIEGNSLLIDNGIKGNFRIAYHVDPRSKFVNANKVTLDNFKSTDVVPLDEDLCALLPLLIASYVWLEDEPERSQYYYTRYQEQTIAIERKGRQQQPIKYVTNGW